MGLAKLCKVWYYINVVFRTIISPLTRGTHMKRRLKMETKDLMSIVKEMAKEIAKSYQLPSQFNEDFLAEMIRRKYWHPEEGTLSIAERTGQKMPSINKKGHRILASTPSKNLQRLEEELQDSEKLIGKPMEEHFRGYLISNIVKYEANQIRERLQNLATD